MMRIKARIVDAMRRNRECSAQWLLRHVYGKRARWTKPHVLKAHIWQLRKMGYPIHGADRGSNPSRYVWDDSL